MWYAESDYKIPWNVPFIFSKKSRPRGSHVSGVYRRDKVRQPFLSQMGRGYFEPMTWLSEAALTTAVHVPFFHWSLYFFSHSSVWLCVVKLIISEYSITWMLDNLPIMQVKLKRIIGVQFGAFRRNIKIAETTEDGTIYLPCFFGVVPSSVLPLIALF